VVDPETTTEFGKLETADAATTTGLEKVDGILIGVPKTPIT